MRELKFRAWSKRCEEYIEDVIHEGTSWLEAEGYDYVNVSEIFGGDEFIVEQYTGLKDKNGEPIYEGDIVKYAWTRCNYIVAYRKYDASFVLENDDREEIILFQYNRQNDYEVIGTIHENPELLEDEG